MHSTNGVTKGVTFLHNGDFSGELLITIEEDATWEDKTDPTVEWTPPNEEFGFKGYWTLRIPFEDIKSIVANHVMSRKISKLEEADADELLGITNG